MFDTARLVVIVLLFCNCALGVFPLKLEQKASQVAGGSAGAVVRAASSSQSFRQHHHHRLLLQDGIIVPSPQSATPKPPPKQDSGRGLNPSVVIIVVILTVVFLLSGFLHLLARCCGRVAARREPTESAMSAIHGQLQQLFQLHDSGVDQAFIDTLPVFPYKAICGLKEGTDCAVCLSEFENEDRLRLLPKCKHAFHIDCIDTWLLSHSTCPLCRCALLSDEAAAGNAGYSDSDRLGSTRSMRSDGYAGDSRRTSNMSRRNVASSSMLAEHGGGSGSDLGKDEDARMMGGLGLGLGMDSPEIQPVLDRSDSEASVASVLSVKLGRVERKKTKRKDIMGSSILRGRSYSMGSYEYVVDPANLQVIIAPTPYPGRGNSREFTYDGRPRHRTVFSDGIPELGSIPGTPADELFWATRGLATPQYGDIREGMGTPDFLNARTPDFLTSRTPDFVMSKDEGRDGNGAFRLNLGHLASEASLVPKEQQHIQEDEREQDAATLGSESTGSSNSICNVSGRSRGRRSIDVLEKEWETIDLKEAGDAAYGDVGSTSLQQQRQQQQQPPSTRPPSSQLREAFGEKGSGSESEESRVMAGLERFFGTGWRSNVGLEKLAESMSRREKTPMDGLSLRSKSEHGVESLKDHHSVSSRAFSFRFPVPESLAKLGRSRRSLSDTTAALISKESAAAASTTTTTTFETASKDTTTGYETASKAGSKDAGFETASKESLGGLDSSSVGSFDSSWIAPPVQQGPPPEDNVVNHNEANQQASSLARKTIHWLMGRDRRVQVHAANFSPTVAAPPIASGSNSLRNNDENL